MNKNEKFVIAINREVGSGGHVVGEKLAERLGVKFYDKDIIKELTKRFNLSVDELEEVRSSKFNWWNNLIESYMNRYKVEERFAIESTVATTENVFRVESDFLKQLADDESCVIARNYDLVIDISEMTEDQAVDLIMDYIDKTFRKEGKK